MFVTATQGDGEDAEIPQEEDGPRANIWGTTVSVHETRRRFKIFLETFQDEPDKYTYLRILNEMAQTEVRNSKNLSLNVFHDYDDSFLILNLRLYRSGT